MFLARVDQGAPRSCGTRPKIDPPPGLSFFRLIEIERASADDRPRRGETPATAIDTVAGVGDRRLAASGSDSAGRQGRGRATDRKGGAVALIRARVLVNRLAVSAFRQTGH